MSPLESLAPDQRAVVALILQQGRSYDEIATLLGIQVDAVRARARAGLAALAPDNGLPPEVTAPLADYLLAQQPEADAEATRGLLAESAPARAWATGVAERLTDVAPAPLPPIPAGHEAGPSPSEPGPAAAPAATGAEAPPVPEVAAPTGAPPAPAAEAPAPRPRPVREPAATPTDPAPPASSKLGGILLIAAVIAIVGVVLFLVLRGGDDPSGEEAASASPTATATATPSATPEPKVTDQITLRPPGGGKAKGTMTVYLQGEQLLFALQGQGLPPSSEQGAYAVWLTKPGAKAHRLGFTGPVGEDGALGIQGPSDKDLQGFPQLYATYDKVVVSQERTEDAKRPTNVVLAGRLPAGR